MASADIPNPRIPVLSFAFPKPPPVPLQGRPPLASKAVHDDLYYLDTVVFQVEGRLFKVPKHYFAHKSDIFKTTFTLPQNQTGESQEGSSDATPFKLEGIRAVDFRRLLKVMYPLEIVPAKAKTQEEWVSVLKLSTMWGFDDIRNLAITQLDALKLGPIDKIALAKAYRVPLWLRSGCKDLVLQTKVISVEEAEKIGFPTAIRIFHAREDLRKGSGEHLSIVSLIEGTFKEELKELL